MRDHFDDIAGAVPEHTTRRPEATAPPAQEALMRLQREAGNEAVSSMLEEERSPVLDVVGSGGGSPMPAATRSGMEARFGADFGGVRLHTDSAAASSAQSVQARAYTVGEDVVLGSGVDPASAAGEKTLAHELTHVLQQRAGDVDGTAAGGGIKVSDPGDRFEQEAEHTAERVMSGQAADIGAATASPAAGVQREGEAAEEAEEDQDPLQATPLNSEPVQRQEEEQLDEELGA